MIKGIIEYERYGESYLLVVYDRYYWSLNGSYEIIHTSCTRFMDSLGEETFGHREEFICPKCLGRFKL